MHPEDVHYLTSPGQKEKKTTTFGRYSDRLWIPFKKSVKLIIV